VGQAFSRAFSLPLLVAMEKVGQDRADLRPRQFLYFARSSDA
jgi:hypothetical protein